MRILLVGSRDSVCCEGKISEGVSFSKILDDIRNNVQSIYDVTTVISKRDLRNVERDFNLVEGKAHSSDYVSVRIWMENMSSLTEEENPIIYSYLENDDYDHLLTTLVVVDEYGNGFPCFFCFTKKKDTKTWITFFTKIKDRTGNINTKVFMSDDDPAFYNAWCNVMGNAEHKLLCSWHVYHSWRKQIQTKIKGSFEKKTYVYKTLKILTHETNVEDFENMLAGTSDELRDDNDTKEFYHYFQCNYLNRVEKWAYCHRNLCGINTNMYLESIHKTIKYFYLNGKKNKRMDQCINALLKFIRDKIFERFIKLAKNKYCSKEDKIMMSHNAAVKICDAKIERMSPITWKIISTTEKESSYDVKEHSVQNFFTQPDESTEQFDNFEKLLVNQDITEPVEKEKNQLLTN
ncbi:uncharacterized protein LOC115034976 [Acyrthosiphon pisum]|uniref:MULE transposase domain-containing protein n=1 Tax=Acyrthosiphon pisum TaxID=7029 RepID=A0A8R2JVF8_ACYPI|nr:uncharacterized protein LOC115034976 [Acyrthosiphon pisum]